MKNGIRYKDVIAMPGSELHDRLSEGDKKKAEQCYNACIQRYKRSIGELKFHGWEQKEVT